MSSREIVTFQLGHFSNFIGTHWWNIQNSSFIYDPALLKDPKEVNHDVLFREGQTLQGHVTYTPRLICFDLKGSLNNLKKDGNLYDDRKQEDDVKWHGDVTLHNADSLPKNEYLRNLDEQEPSTDVEVPTPDDDKEIESLSGDIQPKAAPMETEAIEVTDVLNLDDTVKVWSDYLGIHFHPKSLSIIDDYLHGNDDQPFDIFGLGSQVFSKVDFFEEQFENKLHFFVEECDQLQGFQILTDTYNSFGGCTSQVLQYLDDEFHNKSIFTIGSTPSTLPHSTLLHKAYRCINSALCYHSSCEHSSLFLPLSMSSHLWNNIGPPVVIPHLKYKASLDYHTSAVLAACLDNMSLPYRQFSDPGHMRDITHTFNSLGRKCAALGTSMPFALAEDGTLVDSLMSLDGKSPLTGITPYIKNRVAPRMQSCVIRGIPEGHVNRKTQSSPAILSQCSTAEEVLQLYMTEMYSKSLNSGKVFRDPCKVVSPYPHIFDRSVTEQGFISDSTRPKNQGVQQVPMMTSLTSSDETAVLLDSLVDECSKINLKQYNQFLDSGLESDEYKEILDNLCDLSDCYKDR